MLRRSFLGLSPLVLAWPALAAAPPAEGGKGGDSEVRFVRLPALTANILRSNRTQGVIVLESGLYVADWEGFPPGFRPIWTCFSRSFRGRWTRRLASRGPGSWFSTS